jgi:succinoglycan biosynthesis transport protein ExoP
VDTRLDQDRSVRAGFSDEIDLQRLVGALLDRWKLIATSAAVAIILAIVFLAQATPIYRAAAKVLIDTRQQRVLTSEDILPGFAADASVIESQVELLTSAQIANRVLNELDKQGQSDAEVRPREYNDKEIREFLSNLTVSRIGLTYLIEIGYSSPDPTTASNIANGITRAYIAEEAESKVKLIGRANLWLQDRIKQLAPEVRALEEKIHEYRVTNKLVSLDAQSVTERSVVDYIQQLGLARAALAEAEAKLTLSKERSAASLQAQNDYEVAKMKVALMERGIDTLTAELMSRKRLAIQLGELEREANAAKGLYESLLKRQKETEVQQNLQTINARIVEEAVPPANPHWPKKALVLAVFAAGGIVISILFVLADVILRDGAHRLRDISRHVGLECDLAIPFVRSNSRAARKTRKIGRVPALVEPLIYSVGKGESQFRQVFRIMFYRIRQRIGGASATVAIISPRSGDGKTVIATNFAFTAGDLGERVLLIDISADKNLSTSMAASTENRSDGGQPLPGPGRFLELANGDTKLDFYRWPMTKHGSIHLSSEIQAFVTRMREHYSLIILDTAPLLKSVDTIRLLQNFDVAILVVAKATTPLREVRSMISLGNLDDKTNLTIVINKYG